MALPSAAAGPALLLTYLLVTTSAQAHLLILQTEATTTEPQQNTTAVQPDNAWSHAFPLCANDAGCPGALMCVERTCGCPFSRPVLILGSKDRLGPLCEPLRQLHEECAWSEQCVASDPGMECKKRRCQCVGRPSPWHGVCRARSVTKPLIWAACFAVIALIVAGLMFCFSQSPNHVHLPFDSRHKSACFSESCLLSTGSVLHNPAAQRLLFSRRKVDSAGDTCRTSAVSRGSTPRNDVQCPSAMSAARSGRPVPLPRGFLSCHGLPLDDARGDLGRSSRSLAADGPSWPPILLLERSEPSLELQVISLGTLHEPLKVASLASVHSLRRASAPALVVSPCQVDPPQASSPLVHSEGGEPAGAQPVAALSVGHDWASKLGEQLANESYGFTMDISQSSLPAVRSTVSGTIDGEYQRASRQSRLRRNISESLRRELTDAWQCNSTLPPSRLLLQPPAFLSPEHLSSAPESPGSD